MSGGRSSDNVICLWQWTWLNELREHDGDVIENTFDISERAYYRVLETSQLLLIHQAAHAG